MADGGTTPIGTSSSTYTLKASPAGKALCPFAVKTSGGTVLDDMNCDGTVGFGVSSPAGRFHMLSSATNHAPASFTTDDFLVGLSPASGVGSGAVFIRWDNTNTVGVLGSLSPGTSWRPLDLAALQVNFTDASGATWAAVNPQNGNVSSSAASGTDAFAATLNGARWHFGAGASDYASSDGITVTFQGPLAASALTSGGKPVPAVTSASVAQEIEVGTVALVGGLATVNFSPAYAAAPVCTLSDQTANPAQAAQPTPSATSLVIHGTGTDTIAWICIGNR